MDKELQDPSLEESPSNVSLSSTDTPDSLDNPNRERLLNIQEPILNPAPPPLPPLWWFIPWTTNNGHNRGLAQPHLPPPRALLNPVYVVPAEQQRIFGPPPNQYMAPPVRSSSIPAESQSLQLFDATANVADSMRSMTREKIDIVFRGVLDRIEEMMTHPTASLVVERLIEVADDDQKQGLVMFLAQRKFLLRKFCGNTHGSRVLQTLVQNLKIRCTRDCLVLALRPIVHPLARDDNGCEIVIQCIRNFSDDENKPIFTELARHCCAIGLDRVAHQLLIECLSRFTNGGPNVALVVGHIAEKALPLSHGQYGNFVVQHAIQQKVPQLTINILAQLQGKYIDLSEGKYGSNVVEKCLVFSTRDQAESIIHELLNSDDISKLLTHPYGNYVVQAMLVVSKNQGFKFQHRKLLALVRDHFSVLKNTNHGSRLLKWISSSPR